MSKDLELNSEHVEQGLSRFTERFKEAQRLRAYTAALIRPYQAIEDALQALYEIQSSVDAATGVHLDALGFVVGQAREGRTDEVYRLWIKARIIVNHSVGAPDDFLKVMQILEPSSEREYSIPAAANIYLRALGIDSDPDELFKILKLMKPAGVRLLFEYGGSVEANSFIVGTTASPTTSLTQGFGHGHLAGLTSS